MGLGIGGEPKTGKSSPLREHHLLPFSRYSRGQGFVSFPFPICKTVNGWSAWLSFWGVSQHLTVGSVPAGA